jgi:hypothetical protein
VVDGDACNLTAYGMEGLEMVSLCPGSVPCRGQDGPCKYGSIIRYRFDNLGVAGIIPSLDLFSPTNVKEVFEVAKFWWNNLIPGAPRDSINLLFGISHPWRASSPGKVRLSANQYLVYKRRVR